MYLKNNLFTDTGWEIYETAFDADQLVTTGSNLMIGNGYMGYRGTMAEWEADRYVACIVTDTYDMADGKTRELCNAPNGLYTRLLVDDEPLSMFGGETLDYRRTLDLSDGTLSRRQTWRSPAGSRIMLDAERFASYDNLHLLTMRYAIQALDSVNVKLTTGIDGRVWNLNGEHFREYNLIEDDDLIAIETVTTELGIRLNVVEGVNLLGKSPVAEVCVRDDRRILRCLDFHLDAGETVVLEKVVAIYSSNDVDMPYTMAAADVRAALNRGYHDLKESHTARWDYMWNAMDIQIDGDCEAQTITRFNLYHNTISTPAHADDLPIGARGLSCQVYQGAAFWDQEIFNLPMFVYTRPDVARKLLTYRYHTLDGARGKARRLGYAGAYYAWASGKTGEELFPDYFFVDLLTGRKIRNHFNDWQIHISPDIVYALWQYYEATEDWGFIVEYGAEITFEVAKFLASHAYFKKDKNRYEFLRVLGPDEYHEGVFNNAFTNYQAQYALDVALTFYRALEETAPDTLSHLLDRLNINEDDIELWQEMIELIYLPGPAVDTHLIEQFDDYFDLEDTTPEELRTRLKDPDEYWGWPTGVAVYTQVNKQADVVQLLALHRRRFSLPVVRANYAYYERRTEHGSSLSPSVHALVASNAGFDEQAYAYFLEAATIDLYSASKKVMSGGSFLGGIHTAAAGAVWQMIVQGFAGFELDDHVVRFSPSLPASWEKLTFPLMVRSQRITVEINTTYVAVHASETNAEGITVAVIDQEHVIPPGGTATFMVYQTPAGVPA